MEKDLGKDLDKMFLLTYTAKGYDGFTHAYHAWFATEEELRSFVSEEESAGREIETDLAIEIQEYRSISL